MNKLSVGQRIGVVVVSALLAVLVVLVTAIQQSSQQGGNKQGAVQQQLEGLLLQQQTMASALPAIMMGQLSRDDAYYQLRDARRDMRSQWRDTEAEVAGLLGDTELRRLAQLLDDVDVQVDDLNMKLRDQQVSDTQLFRSSEAQTLFRSLQDLQAALSPAQSASASGSSLTLCLVSGGVAVLLIIIGMRVVQSVVRPLSTLQEAIEITEKRRDLRVRMVIGADDEIGKLAAAYQRLLDQVGETIASVIQVSSDLTESSGRLAGNTGKTREDMSNQSRETDQVATASTEMTQAIEEVSQHALTAAQAANRANEATSEGGQVLSEAIDAINRLAQRIGGATDVINRVENDSTAIGSVLDVIRGIAEQTNLLALNAAIEAARAGEQGRGFAVVADEVRSLARRTQESTEEIQQMIERLQAGTREAVATMEVSGKEMQGTVDEAAKAGDSLQLIAESVDEINHMNSQIASATEQQRSVSQEISRNVVNIADISKRAEEAMTDVDESGRRLSLAAEKIKSLVSGYKA